MKLMTNDAITIILSKQSSTTHTANQPTIIWHQNIQWFELMKKQQPKKKPLEKILFPRIIVVCPRKVYEL